MSTPKVAGLTPWLPWPLSRWVWWTEPVRAERLAVLRISVSALVLLDILASYLPNCSDYFSREGLGNPELYAYRSRAPRWHWSLLHGLHDPLMSSLALAAGLLSFVYLVCGLGTRRERGETPLLRGAALSWTIAALLVLLGQWGRLAQGTGDNDALLATASAAWAMATLLVLLDFWRRRRHPGIANDPWISCGLAAGWLLTGVLSGLALWTWCQHAAPPAWLHWAGTRWDEDAQVLRLLLLLWAAATALLGLGLWSRASAVAVWVLSTSFATLNPCIDNAGDSIRGIALFYLMLSPCGAAWSLDRWRARRKGQLTGPVFVHPWPLRLLFLQLVFIYFCNGAYKLGGVDWRAGNSLYYVFNDVVLMRFSYQQFPVPVGLTRLLSWSVLTWEVLFPLLVAIRWTRVAALWFGVALHLGIFVGMELGLFAPYILALYLPLLPWERWADRRSQK